LLSDSAFLVYHFASFPFLSVCVFVSEVCFLQIANSWILFMNTISQSTSFNWWVKIIYILEIYLLIPLILLVFSPSWFECYLFFSFSLTHFRRLLVYWIEHVWFCLNSHFFIYSSHKLYSFLAFHDCSFSWYVCRIPLSVFSNSALVVKNCFSLCLCHKVFTSPLILKDKFSGYCDLDYQLFKHQGLKYIISFFPVH
jgi:hypothetical protein